ncbi:MAG: UDP-N-acetylmuramoyl-tripeptide--D-alanyl-D-alanine ligase [Bacteroidia bacterium]|nr:UDP-N-acetylmuramoyl-tripeptide--D-alanyl-D-alanine ligase [Bacteroidia bacterium]
MIKITDLLNIYLQNPAVTTDTRKVRSGDIFFALRGDKFDGNAYAAAALEQGAAWAVIDNPQYLVPGDERYLLTDNTLKTLQDLAHAWRKTFDIPILAITGTNGKTTSKELIYAALSQGKKAWATTGNLNNHIGVPLTLLAMPRDTEIAIVEMGANQPGDIRELVEIAEPTHGLITNIGYAHLERFVNIDGVQKTKGEMFDFIRERGGSIFLNETDERVKTVAEGIPQTITFGTPHSDYYYELRDHQLEHMTVAVYPKNGAEPLVIHTRITGLHNCMNILAAVAVADTFGVSRENIRTGLEAYIPANNRSQILERGSYKVWLDAYNANPSSMRAAISNLFSLRKDKVVLILGDMFELGKDEIELHAALGEFINEFSPQMTIGIGPLMWHTVERIKGPKKWFSGVEEARAAVAEDVKDAALILLKGSRGMALERLAGEV